jgi:UDP-N-acetylglucosamine--N-acetylmuramyl-(pentapeptide) pyrophosphoryl-undecaprenol N-acetylglucosamine transferase
LAEVLQEQGHEVLFAGTSQGIESRLVQEAGIPFKPFEAQGFDRSRPLGIFGALRTLAGSTRDAKRWLLGQGVDAVAVFGGYVCLPIGRAAVSLGIPLVVHEQNSVMGLANKHLAKHAHTVALTYDLATGTPQGLRKAKGQADRQGKAVCPQVVLTGNPVRKAIALASRQAGREYLCLPQDALVLLVFGGSLGARHINQALISCKDRLLKIEGLYLVQVSGPKDYEWARDALALAPEEQERWKLFAYQDRMAEVLAAADMVLARAGATSLAEISARKLPALLVPFPFATGDHQTSNARSYVASGAAALISDADLDTPAFAEQLFALIEQPELRAAMQKAAQGLATGDAAARLADVVIAATGKAHNGYNTVS